MIDLQKIQDNIKQLLTKYPGLRKLKYRKDAIWTYWKMFENLTFGITKDIWLYHLTNPETISRAIRKCQEENPELRPSPEEDQERYEAANSFREFHKPKEL